MCIFFFIKFWFIFFHHKLYLILSGLVVRLSYRIDMIPQFINILKKYMGYIYSSIDSPGKIKLSPRIERKSGRNLYKLLLKHPKPCLKTYITYRTCVGFYKYSMVKFPDRLSLSEILAAVIWLSFLDKNLIFSIESKIKYTK